MKEGIPAERSERILWIGEGMGLGEIMAERDDSKHLCLASCSDPYHKAHNVQM